MTMDLILAGFIGFIVGTWFGLFIAALMEVAHK